MVNGRNKGASFERAIAGQLFGLTGVSFKRNLEQTRAQDQSDLIPDNDAFPFSLELKRYADGTGCKPAWREQSAKAAEKLGRFPAVVWKYDRRDVMVSIPIEATHLLPVDAPRTGYWVETTIECFAYLVQELMAINATQEAEE